MAIVFVMSKLLATETSQRVGDELGNFNFQKAYIDFGRNCTPMESEDDGCSCNFVSIFCDYNFLCLTNTLLFIRLSTMSSTGVNLMVFSVLWGDNLTGTLTSIDVFIRFL